jgi:hypothetical protein
MGFRNLRFLLFLLLILSCRQEAPVILSLDPALGAAGEILTIRGRNFQAERAESYLTIAGLSPTASAYVSWTDEAVSVRIPDGCSSGLVYVHVGEQTSNPGVFTHRDFLPRPLAASGLDPAIQGSNSAP